MPLEISCILKKPFLIFKVSYFNVLKCYFVQVTFISLDIEVK
jgi:hypothetical protein